MSLIHDFKYSSLILLSCISLSACNGGSNKGDGTDSTATDSVLHVEMDPSAFPVNAIPDNQFGKTVTISDDPSLKSSSASLKALNSPLPQYVDAIISRESIVCFGKVMTTSPDELEFVQQEARTYDAGAGWSAFSATFKTRPSGMGMVVYGGYKDEQTVFWASAHRNGPLEILLSSLVPASDGISITGAMTTDKGPQTPFKADLKKESVKVAYGAPL